MTAQDQLLDLHRMLTAREAELDAAAARIRDLEQQLAEARSQLAAALDPAMKAAA